MPQVQVNEIHAKELFFIVELVDGSKTKITFGKRARFLMPASIKAIVRDTAWLGITYQGLRIDFTKTKLDGYANVLVAEDGTRIIF